MPATSPGGTSRPSTWCPQTRTSGSSRVFLDRAGAWMERAGDGIEDRLPAIQRLKWHLVRRGLADELIDVLRFQRTEMRHRPRAMIGGGVYGDYPFLHDEALAVPRSVYRLDMTRRRAAQAVTLLRPCRVLPRAGEPTELPGARATRLPRWVRF